jgi:hypothetical protein
LRTHREDAVGVVRKQRPRRPEKCREEVEQHRRPQDPVRAEVREALNERASDRRMDARLARRRDERGDRGERDEERSDIDPVRAGDAEGDDHDTGERGPGDRRDLEQDLVQCHRGGKLLAGDEARRQRATRGSVERRERGTDRGQGVEVRHAGGAELGPDRQCRGTGREAELRHDEQPAAVDAIGNDAAEEREAYQRDRLEESDESDVEG